ncbi:MAG TPA: CDP-alcohol phosphatidyltransferase family protein [Pyrinomonadaceae bacterium]|nr:CDP-alcohol phosphatidyltransferase family protein [Pyrinomonadaceae bacterium]
MSSRIVTLPNILTVVRMGLIPVFVTALYYQRFEWALAIFIFAGLTDGIDGFLARRFDQKSQLGTILDPIADKLLLVTSFITLSLDSIVARGNHLPVPFWVTAAVISRDVFIVVGSAAINVVTGFRGFRPSMLGKINTVVQIGAIVVILVMARLPAVRGYVLPTVYAIVFLFAVISGIHYVFWAAKLMNDEKNAREES